MSPIQCWVITTIFFCSCLNTTFRYNFPNFFKAISLLLRDNKTFSGFFNVSNTKTFLIPLCSNFSNACCVNIIIFLCPVQGSASPLACPSAGSGWPPARGLRLLARHRSAVLVLTQGKQLPCSGRSKNYLK